MKTNPRRRLKKARQKQRYANWKQSGKTISEVIQHFEIYAVFENSPRVRLLRRRLAYSVQEVENDVYQGLDSHKERGTRLCVLERFDPKKQFKLKVLRHSIDCNTFN